jgi:hypothetical protein
MVCKGIFFWVTITRSEKARSSRYSIVARTAYLQVRAQRILAATQYPFLQFSWLFLQFSSVPAAYLYAEPQRVWPGCQAAWMSTCLRGVDFIFLPFKRYGHDSRRIIGGVR